MNFKRGSLLLMFLMVIGSTVSQCPTDTYSPCYCVSPSFLYDESNFRVTCNRSSLALVKAAGFATSKTNVATSIVSFLLIPSSSDTTIPADLIGNRTVTTLTLSCPTFTSYLSIDPNAFRASKSSLTKLNIRNCDLRNFTYNWLTGFTALTSISIFASFNNNRGFYTLPYLPALTGIRFESIGITYTANPYTHAEFPILANNQLGQGLSSFDFFYSSQFDDYDMKSTLNWLLPTSADTMKSMSLCAETLSKFIPQIGSFSKLNFISFYNNFIPTTLPPGSFYFNIPVSAIYSDNSKIYNISAGAFYGDFTNAQVSLYNNQITRFESDVFKSILQQMVTGTGYLEIFNNPIDCSTDLCHMAWLIRDNRNLLSAVYSGRCSNGTFFYQLNSAAYTSCPYCS